MSEPKTSVINGRLHMEGEDGIYRLVPTGMDEARTKDEHPTYVNRNDKFYEVIDAQKYAQRLVDAGVEQLTAKKSGCVIIRKGKEGETIPVYTANGNLEATETCQPGKYIVTRADMNGEVIIDQHGHTNQWQISEETLRKKYAVPDDIANGTFAEPKGGPQIFIQTGKDIAVMVPWGENGSLIPQTVDNGGYLNITNMNDIYGIANTEFHETYSVISKTSKAPAGVQLDSSLLPDESTSAGMTGPEIG